MLRRTTRLAGWTAAAYLVVLLAGCDARDDTAPNADVTAPAAPPRLDPLPEPLLDVFRTIARGRFEEARVLAMAYTEAHPEDGRGPFMVGLTWQKAGNHGPAVAHFRKALELAPDYYLTHRYLGESLLLLGDLAGARTSYAAFSEVDPAEPDGQYGLGLVDLEEGRLDEAEARFRRAIELIEALRATDLRAFNARQAGLARCHARLGDVHFARDDYEAARDELVLSTTIAPRHISALYTLSLVYRRLGDDVLADATLRRYEVARQAVIRGAGDAP